MFLPLRERNFRLGAAADLVSTAGTWMQVLGLNWLVLAATGSAATMGSGGHAAVAAGAGARQPGRRPGRPPARPADAHRLPGAAPRQSVSPVGFGAGMR
jgi:hypothetical protein